MPIKTPKDIYDLEFDTLVRSGKLREWFGTIYGKIERATSEAQIAKRGLEIVLSEKNAALKEIERLQAALRLRDIGYKGPIATSPPVISEPPPVIASKVEPPKTDSDLDDTATRFSLLELD